MASPLTALTLVFPTNVPDIITFIISDFLVPDFSIAWACTFGSVALLDFIWTRSLRDAKKSRWTVARLLQCEPHYCRWECGQAMREAMRREDRSVIEWVVAHFPKCDGHYAMICAEQELKSIQRSNEALSVAAIRLSGQDSRGPRTCAMDSAASKGDLDELQSLHKQHRLAKCTAQAMDSAAFNGHLDVVKWLHLNRSEGCTTAAMDKAAANGNLEMVKWLRLNRTEGCSSWALDMVASKSVRDKCPPEMAPSVFNDRQLKF